MNRELHADLERLVHRRAGRGRSSLIAGVSVGDERAYFAFGPASTLTDQLSLFEIGSITKVFTGTLLADMHLRGEVNLDDPLSEYLPTVELPRWPGQEPSLAQLATHRAGLPNTPRALAWRELAFALGLLPRDPWASVSRQEYADLVARIRPRAVGRAMRYSSVGFGLLGDALARRGGQPYEQLLSRRICLPLGLRETRVEVRAGEPRLLGGHSRRGRPRPPFQDLMPAAGGLRSHAEDMLRFLEAALDPPARAPGPALQLAQAPQVKQRGALSGGLGWMLLERPGHPRMIWHNGGTWGFRSFAGAVPGSGVAVVVLANTTLGVDRLGVQLAEACSGQSRS